MYANASTRLCCCRRDCRYSKYTSFTCPKCTPSQLLSVGQRWRRVYEWRDLHPESRTQRLISAGSHKGEGGTRGQCERDLLLSMSFVLHVHNDSGTMCSAAEHVPPTACLDQPRDHGGCAYHRGCRLGRKIRSCQTTLLHCGKTALSSGPILTSALAAHAALCDVGLMPLMVAFARRGERAAGASRKPDPALSDLHLPNCEYRRVTPSYYHAAR
jgi:hypothetical protein